MQKVKRRNYKSPDGLDWRDENMPVVRYGIVDGVEGSHLIKPEHIQQYYIIKMNSVQYDPPTWKNDPSYFWSQKHNRKPRI